MWVRPNHHSRKVRPRSQQPKHRIITDILHLVIGRLVYISIINPMRESSMAAAVEVSPSDRLKTSPHSMKATTINTSVRAAGRALMRTFFRKCPLMRREFFSRVSKNPGIPMVNMAT